MRKCNDLVSLGKSGNIHENSDLYSAEKYHYLEIDFISVSMSSSCSFLAFLFKKSIGRRSFYSVRNLESTIVAFHCRSEILV